MYRIFVALCMLSVACAASVRAEPVKLDGPLTLVVGYAPGGASDRIARLVSDGLQKRLRIPVVVENRSGAGGRLAAQWVRSAGAKQDILMLANPAVMVVAPLVYNNLNYAPTDFQAVSLVSRYDFGVAVSADSSIHDFVALRDWLSQHPEQFNVGVPATGSLPHFFGLMMGQEMGMTPEIVGYRGSAPLMTDLIGGVVPLAIDTLDTLLPQIQGKRIRLLAVSSSTRSAELPDVPTFKELGLDLVADGWNALFASVNMPEEKARWLGAEISDIMDTPALQSQVRSANLVPVSADAEQTREALAAYTRQWAPVVKASGFKAEQ